MNRIISIPLILFLILSACKKEEEKITVPIVETLPAEKVGRYSAQLSGDVNFDEGTGVMSRGIYYSTKENPTMADSTTVNEPVIGTVTDTVVGLNPDTTYYFRAYAEYTSGIVYGEQLSFTTRPAEPIWGDGVTDIDGNFYKSVIIGEQEWMAENLKVTRYRNGDPIETTEPATKDISEETEPKYQWAYDGNPENAVVYGRLYTGSAATDGRGICPEGWHVPGDTEWEQLAKHLGGRNLSGGRLKESGTIHWMSPNANATNETGFTAVPAGLRSVDGRFVHLNLYGILWSSTPSEEICCLPYIWIDHRHGILGNRNNFAPKGRGCSIRCIKD